MKQFENYWSSQALLLSVRIGEEKRYVKGASNLVVTVTEPFSSAPLCPALKRSKEKQLLILVVCSAPVAVSSLLQVLTCRDFRCFFTLDMLVLLKKNAAREWQTLRTL